VVEDDMPKYTMDVVEQCNAILGSYTTEYASSAWGRAANLANGARLINNTVLYPGDTFSAYKVLSPFTQENGYEVAGAYLQGKVIDSVGGGACQVTTTLYNAVLKAELEVVERQSHSMTISYVDLSRDAAIAGTSKNFKFKNNTDVPVLIEATTKNRTITFKIWGHETRDTEKRKIEFKSEVISTTNPPADVITKDPTKPTTYREVTNSAHTGYRAKLWKLVYENCSF
jgi:vancomycin resistance protein YoaR